MPRPVDVFATNIIIREPRQQSSDSRYNASPSRQGERRLKKKKHFHGFEVTTSTRGSTSSSSSSSHGLPSTSSNIRQSQSFYASSDTGASENFTSPKQNALKKNKKGRLKDGNAEEECSSEEERWLHAIESGKLEEVDDELKKISRKDPKLMTARQRAMLERKSDKDAFGEQLLALPSGYREKIVTPEMLEEKAKKLQKRKIAADAKRENDKKKTMERLLKKSESKTIKLGQKSKSSKKSIPKVVYMSNTWLNTITMPENTPFPLCSTDNKMKQTVYCGVQGCTNVKRYSCSKTGVPLCSLNCYRKNLSCINVS